MSNSEPNFVMPKSKKQTPIHLFSVLNHSSIQKRFPSNAIKALLCSLCLTPYQAWSNDQNCMPERIAQQQDIPAKNSSEQTSASAQQNIEADRLLQPSNTQYILQGNAILKQPGLVVLSDEALYDKNTKTAIFDGNVEVHQPEMLIKANKAKINNEQGTAFLDDTQYQLLPSRTHGKSDNIEIDEKQEQAKLAKATLTTCKVNADDTVDWDMKFEDLTINNQTRRIVGNNTTVYFKGVPIFYTPYFDYPMDNRASGLLFPEVGSYKPLTQSNPHQYVKVPYYFNIAPNIDDTLTAIPITERGLALENEFRYIAKTHDVVHSADITLTGIQDQVVASKGLASADAFGNVTFGDKQSERWRATVKANQNWGHDFSSTIDWTEVSDENFFADIPVQSELRTVTQKQRSARVDYRNDNFQAYAQLLSYLRLQNAATNYEKRPEIGVSYAKYINNFDFDINATLTDFHVPVSGHTKPEAVRFHTAPTLSHQFENSYARLKSTLVANQTQYQMKDNGYNTSGQDSINRFIPQFAIRGGLIFERGVEFGGQNYIQTLEPEIQYLYTPYEDQSGIALFDTANRSLAFSNLFELNRFTGADRIGDSNQISTALTSRLLTSQGSTLAEAGIGQIHYLADRQVTLNGSAPETEKYSDIFVKLGLTLKDWYFSSTTQFDNDNRQLTNANTRLKWQQPTTTLLLNHTLNNLNQTNETEMLSMGGYTQIYSKWDLGIYSSYDMQQSEIYETQIGLRYDSCCWATEFIAERTQLENGLYNDGIQVQFELKGLSTSGTRFKQAITNKLNF